MAGLSHKESKWLDKVALRAESIIGLKVTFEPILRKSGSSHRVVKIIIGGYSARLPYSTSSLNSETIDNFSKQIRRGYRLHHANQ